MEHENNFRVPVAAAPAYLTATIAAVSSFGALIVIVTVGYLLVTMGRVAGGPAAGLVYVDLPLLAAGLLAASVVMAFVARAEFRLLRDPPVFTAVGVRMRVFAGRGHDVFVPWERVTRLRIADKGRRPFLLVEVDHAEELVGDDPVKARRLRRTEERFEGAAFVYGLRGALIRAEDLGVVVDRLSDGAVCLDY